MKYFNPVTSELLTKDEWVAWAHTIYAAEGHVHTDEYCWTALNKIFKLEEVGEIH